MVFRRLENINSQWILLGCIMSVLVYVSDKGFDFTDEGLYALFSNPLQNNTYSPLNFDFLYKLFFKFFSFEFDIRSLRLARIIMNVCGSLVLFFGLNEYNRSELLKKAGSINLFAFVIISGFWNYLPILIQSPGYGAFHFFGLQIFTGALLFLVFQMDRSVFLKLFFLLVLLTGIFISWLSKPTGVPFMLLLLAGMMYLYRRNVDKQTLLILGISSCCFLLCFYLADISHRITPMAYKEVFESQQLEYSSHSLSVLISRLARDIFFFLASLLCGFAASFLVKAKRYIIVIGLIVVLATIVISEICVSANRYNLQGAYLNAFLVYRLSICIPIAIAIIVGYYLYNNFVRKDQALIAVFFCFIAVSYVFGSNTNNLYNLISCLQFILISVWLVLQSKHQKIYFGLSSFIVAMFISYGFLIMKPERQRPIIDQKFAYKYGENNRNMILLDADSYKDQKNLDKIVSKFNTPYIIGYTRMLGHIYLAGKTTPGSVLWGEEDVRIYFRKRFNHPDSFILFLDDKSSEPYIFSFLKGYNVDLVGSVEMTNSFRHGSTIYIYYCNR